MGEHAQHQVIQQHIVLKTGIQMQMEQEQVIQIMLQCQH